MGVSAKGNGIHCGQDSIVTLPGRAAAHWLFLCSSPSPFVLGGAMSKYWPLLAVSARNCSFLNWSITDVAWDLWALSHPSKCWDNEPPFIWTPGWPCGAELALPSTDGDIAWVRNIVVWNYWGWRVNLLRKITQFIWNNPFWCNRKVMLEEDNVVWWNEIEFYSFSK